MQEDRKPVGGLHHYVVDSTGIVLERAWLDACAAGLSVGGCVVRRCGGHLEPRRPTDIGRTRWYEAACATCGHEVAAPHGKVLLGSSLAEDQPPGMQARRDTWRRMFTPQAQAA